MTAHVQHARKGFTLPELMIGLVIIGIVATLVGGLINNVMKRARKTKAESALRELKLGVDTYDHDIGQLPAKLENLIKPSGAKKWDGPYFGKKGIEEIPVDPWRNDYKYQVTKGKAHPYELYSEGPNGSEGPIIDAWDL